MRCTRGARKYSVAVSFYCTHALATAPRVFAPTPDPEAPSTFVYREAGRGARWGPSKLSGEAKRLRTVLIRGEHNGRYGPRYTIQYVQTNTDK